MKIYKMLKKTLKEVEKQQEKETDMPESFKLQESGEVLKEAIKKYED